MTVDPDDPHGLIAWARRNVQTVAGHAITRDQYDAYMTDRDRPLTQDPTTRHHGGTYHNEIGNLL